MAGRFTFAVPASHGKPRTHPAWHKQLDCIDQGRIQPWRRSRGYRARARTRRRKIPTMAFVSSRSASSVRNKIKFLSPWVFRNPILSIVGERTRKIPSFIRYPQVLTVNNIIIREKRKVPFSGSLIIIFMYEFCIRFQLFFTLLYT